MDTAAAVREIQEPTVAELLARLQQPARDLAEYAEEIALIYEPVERIYGASVTTIETTGLAAGANRPG